MTFVTFLNCPFSKNTNEEGTRRAAKKKIRRACFTETRRGENFKEQLVNHAEAAY